MVPALSATMLFSIFMASSTQIVSPAATSAPSATSTFTMVPCIGIVMTPDPAAEPPWAERLGRALRAPPPAAAGAAALSGTHMATANRLPLTSTSTSRRTLGSSPSSTTSGTGGFDDMADRSSTSSTHLVECSKAAKSGCLRMARSAGIVVAMPSTTVSSSARIMRAMAVGRSLAHTHSLPVRLS